MATTTFYYPEGPLGPICDIVIADEVARDLGIDVGDGRVDSYDPIDLDDLERITDDNVRYIKSRRCKQRTLSDGSIEYYDCIDDLNAPIGAPPGYPLIAPQYDWAVESTTPWGLDDNFQGLNITVESCNPHDPDINILPVKFYNPNGTYVEKIQVEKSTPVTFPVDSLEGYDIVDGSINASFVESGGNILLRATGTGTGNISIEYTWDDNPNTAGVAISSLSIAGVSFGSSSGDGKSSGSIEVTAGTDYPLIINGGSGYGGQGVSGSSICFYDSDGTDCNARLTIITTTNRETIENKGAWSDDGNAYGVWVNPEVCTLPTLQQSVTYFIPIPATDTYTITGGADDSFNVFLNDSATPVIGGTAGIFNEQHEIVHTGSYTPPYSATQTLQAGELKMVVQCTNGSTENDADGNPTGSAFVWNLNPGGWYVKICRGDSCISGTSISWVKAGPHAGWANFMNTYAVYPSNNDPLKGIDHTATWNINVPFAGDYTFEYAVDNTGSWELDGTQIATAVDNFSGSDTYTITNLSAGPHTITGTVNNNSGDADDWTNNPAGIAWTLTPNNTASNVSVAFDSNGNIVTTGEGTVEVEFLFEWDDNPNTAGQALGTVTWANVSNLEFTQTQGVSSGSDDDTVVLNGNTTYNIQVFNSTGGFEVQNNGQRICFFDNDGNDCNAQVNIGTITQGQSGIIASSLDLDSPGGGNLIWHTRMDAGYKWVEV